MAQGTKEKDRLDDDLNPATRNIPSDESISAGIDQLQAHANDPANSSPSFKQREANASTSDGQQTSTTSGEQGLGSGDNFTYSGSNDDEGENTGFLKKVVQYRRRIAFGFGGAGVTLGFIGIFLGGPSFITSHLSTLMTDRMGRVEASHQARYNRSRYSKFTDRFSIDGRRGGEMIAEMERYGYKFVFDPADGRSIQAIRRPDGTYAPNSVGAVDTEIQDFMEERYKIFSQPTRSARWKSKRMEAFYKRFNVTRTSVVKALPGDADDPKTEVNKRNYNSIQGDEELDRRVQLPDGEDVDEDTAARNGTKASESIGDEGIFEEDIKDLKNGVDVDDLEGPGKLASEIEAGYGEGVVNYVRSGSLAGRAWGFTKSLFSPTDIADKLCTVNNRLNEAVTIARLVTSAQLMRASFNFITADDGQRRGEASADLLGALMARVTTSDAVLGNFANSTGYQFATTGSYSSGKNSSTRQYTAVDGKLTGVWGAIEDNTDISGCSVWQNPLFQGASAVGTVIISVFTFGSGGVTLNAAGQGAAQAVRGGITNAVKTAIQNGITRRVLVGVGTGLAIDLAFEEIMSLAQLYAQKKLTLGLTGQEQGAMLANVLFAGAGVMHKQRNLMAGQIPATTTEFAQAQTQYLAELEEEQKQQSFADRIFNTDNVDSLASKTLASVTFGASDPYSSVQGFATNIASAPITLASSLTGTLTSPAGAQSDDMTSYDSLEINGTEYATDPSGNLRTILPTWIDEADEIANRDQLIAEGQIQSSEPYEVVAGSEFEKHLENCVYSTDTISPLESGNDSVEFDCRAEQAQTRKYKIHLAYLDANDFLDAYLFPEEISDEGGSASNQTPVNTGSSSQYIPDCSVNGGNAKIACVAIDTMLGVPYKNAYSSTAGCQQSPSASNDPNPTALDCSAFTSMAVYRAFGTDAPRTSTSYLTSPLFEVVGDTRNGRGTGNIRDIQPGDLVGKGSVASGAGGSGHIGIVVSYDPNTKKLITVETDRCNENSRVIETKGLEIDGTGGNYTWAVRYVGPK